MRAGILAGVFMSSWVVAEGTWEIETLAGTGERGFSGDGGPAAKAQLNDPFGVTRGPDGALWFTEFGGHRIRKINPDGSIKTVAGTGVAGYSGDGGSALDATFNQPHEIRFDSEGNYYIADMRNHAIRRVDGKTGVITTVAGTGQPGYAGDGGPAVKALLKQPHSLQLSPKGELFLCDIGNHVVRKINLREGDISTVAGTGQAGRTPDGAPIIGTPLNGPRAMDFDQKGNLWLATREGNQGFRLNFTDGIIHHVAGTGKSGFTVTAGRPKKPH